MFDFVDLYCERAAPGLWGEPFNVLSNLAFLLAAASLWRSDAWRTGTWDTRLLILLLAAIGVGSGLWHLVARRWALWADVVPILLFVSVYLLVFLLRVAGLPAWRAAALFLLFQVANGLLWQRVPADTLNGSAGYLPAIFVVVLIAAHMRMTRDPGASFAAAAGGLLLLSVSLRSVDMAACAAWPVGTHFLWHLLNAPALYLLIRVLPATASR